MPESHAERVAANVRAEMSRNRLTQSDLAECLGISQAAVSRRLTGEVAFDVNELASVASFIGVPVTTLMPDQAIAS